MRFVLMLLFLLLGCGSASSEQSAPSSDTVAPDTSSVRTGAQVLADRGFDLFQGQRAGLIVNHTARVDTAHLADRVHDAPGVTLAALFGPEHGLRGTADAGEKVSDGVDDRTGAPVYSLYGQTRTPMPEMLDGLDVLAFDIQDVGARFYTYISTMGLAMQAASEADLPFVVLDRPNPLGGTLVSGFVLEPEQTSFVGQYPIPVAHGMTVGELAQMIKGEGWLPGLENLDLTVVPVEGWSRAQSWPTTGLPWIPPSPNIPDVETAFVYPGTCFFEATGASEGRGTREPFRLLGAPWSDGQALVDTLTAHALPGVRFTPAQFTPASIEGMASNPKLEGTALEGIRLHVTDPATYRPVATGIHVLHAFYHQAQRTGEAFVTRPDWLDKLSGTPRLRDMLTTGAAPETIIAAWQAEVDAFEQRRAPYLLY